ncbi:hypothetical protein ACPXAT_27125, partial [Klebsiella pneumoniae]|uniref:hypothetical protein n=1 Tax=Klebsiella pneumoniae TaxID=573 RepID=UPI003CF38F47
DSCVRVPIDTGDEVAATRLAKRGNSPIRIVLCPRALLKPVDEHSGRPVHHVSTDIVRRTTRVQICFSVRDVVRLPISSELLPD